MLEELIREAVLASRRKGFRLPKGWRKTEAAYVMSDQMKQDAIQQALDEDKDPDMDGDDDSVDYEMGRVRHVFPDGTFVFQMGWDGDWFKRSFTIEDNGEAKFGNDCTQVTPELTFRPITDTDDVSESMASQALAGVDNRDAAVPFDKAYLQKAVDHHETAMHLATKATTEASDPRVKSLAKKVVKDHAPALAEMKQLHGVIVTGTADPATKPKESFKESTIITANFHEVLEATESSSTVDDTNGVFTISGTAIMPGLNRSGNRVYPKETLSAAVPLFEGKKMYIDHPSAFDERNRPERSFMDAGALITEAWVNPKGGIDYRAVVFDPPLREKLALMNKTGTLHAMGTSVNYGGVAKKITHEGRQVDNIESIDALNSLDFVTEPGAWGNIARMESVTDVVAKVEERDTTVDEKTQKMIEDLQKAVEESRKEAVEARTEAATERKERRISDARNAVATLLEKSSLPEISRDRIKTHFDGVESADGADEIIKAEESYIAKLTEGYIKPKGAAPVNIQARRTNVVVGLGSTGAGITGEEAVSERETAPPTAERFGEAFSEMIPGGIQGATNFARFMG